MFLKRKLTVMTTIALIGSSLLVGCSGSGNTSSGSKTATSAQVLDNENARAAIAMSIDKQSYCDVILNNGSKTMDRFTPLKLALDNGKDYADLTEGMGYSYNEEKAKEAWDKAKKEVGFDTTEMEIITYDHDLGKRTGEFIQSELSDLEGLTVKVTNLPFKQKLDRETKGKFDISFSGWGADYPDPLTFLSTMETGNQFSKQVGYDNKEYNKLIEEAKKLPTAEGYKKYAEAEKMMLEDAYLAPIYQKSVAYLEKDYVSGIVNNSWGADYTYTYADVNKPEKVLNLSTTADIPSMDISKSTDQQSFQVMNTTMEGLIRVDEKGKAQPGVAEKWEVSEDGLTWTFHLRKNSIWSDKTPVTAKDFEYSWKRTLTPETASEYSYIMNDIKGAMEVADKGVEGVGVKALDDYTLEVKLVRPVPYFPQLTSFQVFFPQKQAFVEKCGDKYGTAAEYQLYNGPFTLTSWKMEDQYVMSKNSTYWDASNVKLEKINTKVVKDTGAEVNLYEDGQIDRAVLSSDFVDKYKDSKELKTRETATTFMLQINGSNHK